MPNPLSAGTPAQDISSDSVTDGHAGSQGLKSASRRDHEFRRYAEAVIGLRPAAMGQTAVSSRETALTAYAQLVALRLDVKRAFISLFDASHQYIIAEATRTLSLQRDETHSLSDAMWFGVAVLDRQLDFNRMTLQAHKRSAHEGGPPRRYFEIPDLLNDSQYAGHRFVAQEPYARSYAGVPLLSSNGYAIGTLSFLDDQVRPAGISDDHVVFLQDMARTIMSHLETSRLAITQARGLKMVKGLSRFVEGKLELEDDDETKHHEMEEMYDRQTIRTAALGASYRTHAMNAASDSERLDDARHLFPANGYVRPSDAGSAVNVGAVPSMRRSSTIDSPPPPISGSLSQDGDSDSPRASRTRAEPVPSPSTKASGPESTSRKASTDTENLQDSLLSKDVRHAFERAARIINSAMQVSGTLFLDASVGEFGRLRNDAGSSSSTESEGSNRSGNDDREVSTDRSSTHELKISAESAPKISRQLASAYNITSHPDGTTDVLHKGVPERLLKSLMRRFPYGKIWTFDRHGNTSSDELFDSSAAADKTSDDAMGSAAATKKQGRKKYRSHEDGAKLAELFPGVRSLCLLPMYDQRRERFFAGAIIWSYYPIRVLTAQEDQNYLGAFCDVIMAEVGRLDAQAETRTKTNFISSISHELRSPLHGILGGVECLQDKDNAAIQDEMLQMIESSGKSLLDIIDHLLEHAHANPVDHRQPKSNKVIRNREALAGTGHSTRYNTSSHHQPLSDLATLTEEVINTALWSTPKPTPLPNPSGRPGLARSMSSSTPIKVILEIDSTHLGDKGWCFRINSGAWRRIVQNLVGNAIKYTDHGGFLKVSLSAEADRQTKGDNSTTTVKLVCLDSGRGMSQQYLDDGLWAAFNQEDSNAQGTGLGLSLIHGIVKEMGGKIDVQSTKGVGTSLSITIPLHRSQHAQRPSSAGLDATTNERLRATTYAMVAYREDDAGNERAAEATNILKESVTAACKSHGMHSAKDIVDADIFILPEDEARAMITSEPVTEAERGIFGKPAIILCHSVASSRTLINAEPNNFKNAIIISQPLGPRKLSKALVTCLDKMSNSSTNAVMTHEASDLDSPFVLTDPGTSDFSEDSHWHLGRPVSLKVAKENMPVPVRQKTGLTILLVDDNDVNLSLLRTYVKKNGHDFICASNGQQAVDEYKSAYEAPAPPEQDHQGPNGTTAAKAAPPTVVLMDLTMPVMSGLEATRQIRAYERGAGIPRSMIVALTAMGSAEVKQEAFASGVNLFLTKPLKLKDLSEMMTQHASDAERRGRKKEQREENARSSLASE